jgi:nucleoside-diphosphate-sugar epimerase
MTRFLITGGAGYIGSVLVPILLDRGCHVTVLESFLFQQSSLLECCHNECFDVIRGDAREKDVLSEAMKRADVLIPLAAIVGAPACNADPTAATTTNLEAVRLLLSLRSKDQMIISPCTDSGYGTGQKDKFCTEESPLQPISLYGITKVEAERAILEAGNSISLRLATVFGVSLRMRTDLLVNDFVYHAVTDRIIGIFEGNFKRNYIHVRDVARAFVHAFDNFASMKNQAYNVGLRDANLSKLELCERIRKQVPDLVYMESPGGQDPDKRDYIVSNEKIERTGYKPAVSLDDGIRELIKAYRMIRVRGYGNV